MQRGAKLFLSIHFKKTAQNDQLPLVRAVKTYHNKTPLQERGFVMVGPDGLEPTTRPL